MQEPMGTGYLRVQTVFAGGAFPVEGALVTVTDSEGRAVASLRTDASGLTELLILDAPPRSDSLSPDASAAPPYSTYTVTAERDGFYPVWDYSVPVFDGITSLQQANMIPLSEFSPIFPNPRPQRIETPGYENLKNNGG